MVIVTGSDSVLPVAAQKAWRKADECLGDCDLPMDIERAIAVHDIAFSLALNLRQMIEEAMRGESKT